jgi:dihydroorotase
MEKILITNAKIVNEGRVEGGDLLIENGKIAKVATSISAKPDYTVIDLEGKCLMPGVIDDQVHFREPGLTQKATIASESRAAVAGGVTSFMEMPNTVPNALTQSLLEDKYAIAQATSWANYSFFMGGSNDNYEEVMKTDLSKICGLKLFMGSSTGNMLVDSVSTLERIFSNFPGLIATHCEDEATVKSNFEFYREKYPTAAVPYDIHALIRNEDACLTSSTMAVNLAKKNNTRLHILHISTGQELALFGNAVPLAQKNITSEVCVHHLFFDAADYQHLGNQIKCNPAIKHGHRELLFEALLDDRLDIVATDHAPHTWAEKEQDYWQAPSGLPLVQHSLQIMLDFYKKGRISLEKVVEKMAHAPAECFKIDSRGYIREGYWADLVAVDLDKKEAVSKANTFYKAGWSPLEGHEFSAGISKTFVSGQLVFDEGEFYPAKNAQRLLFKR